MISYYELILLVKTKKQPYKIIVNIDNKEILFEYDYRYNTYIIPSNNEYYQEYDSYLDLNMYEEDFFKLNIKVIEPYLFRRGEYISYFDLINAIKLNTQPYRVRIHINEMYHDYIYDKDYINNTKKYIEYEVDTSIPSWDFYLSNQITSNNWFINNIEVIEAGNSLIRINEFLEGGSYFNIYPVKLKNNNKEELLDYSISIEEDNINAFLYPILKKYFNFNLNQNRESYEQGFDWYSNNYYDFDTLKEMIKEIEEIMYLLKNDYNNKKLDYIKKDYDWILFLDPNIDTRKGIDINLIKNYVDEIINFYKKFIEYLNNMIKVSKDKGYNLITFLGP